ncbi:unnamed protein product [Lactuca saligna]|uniref:Uncharacterized protein n=1 Tax=Lactuca saligna TaxID=75948 RepID=A0AA35UMC4_LACSI|nr:unnamed protein product [Lactuca saligna]
MMVTMDATFELIIPTPSARILQPALDKFLRSLLKEQVDIQALAHAFELTRQGAVDSLKFAKGDLFQAFQNEVCQMRLDTTMLDELIHEYCVYRGIVGAPNPSCEGMKIGHEPSESESTLSVEARNGSNKLANADMDSPGTEE